jgi:hypothetical protein
MIYKSVLRVLDIWDLTVENIAHNKEAAAAETRLHLKISTGKISIQEGNRRAYLIVAMLISSN